MANHDAITKLYNGEIEVKFTEGNHGYYIDGKRKTGVTTFLGIINKPQLIPWAVNTAIDYVREHQEELQNEGNDILELARKEADAKKDYASEIGTAIHAWVEQYINDQKVEMPEDPKVLTGVLSFLEWVESNNVKFISSERIVYSKQHDYIGTLDIEAEIDGKRYLIDIKTGNSLYAEVKAQTAAYLKADEEESGKKYEGRWALRISKDTEEEYYAKQEEKALKASQRAKNGSNSVPYKVFEALYLDEDKEAIERDFIGFLASQALYRWKQVAEKELKKLK